MEFLSICSGIEAASVAWAPIGWKAVGFSEIDPFACAVLAHRFPDVPNYGDMTTLTRRILLGEVPAPDVLCGGTPCQAFSVAGLRESLSDARGNLSLIFCEIADAIDVARSRAGKPPCIIIWENVPGVLSTKDNAFGCFLAGLAGEDAALEPPGGRWANSGAVYGPARAVAWRTLDAQYFGVAQRRRRVFVVASSRAGFDPASVLFEWDSMRRDSAPRREAGQGSAVCPTLRAGGNRTGGDRPPGTDVDTADSLVVAFGGNNTTGPIDVATARNACGSGSGRLDFESETFLVSHSLRGEGFDASKDGTGRGTPLVPVVTGAMPANVYSGGMGGRVDMAAQGFVQPVMAFHGSQDPDVSGDVTHPVGRNHGLETCIDFSSKDHGADAAQDLAPTLRAMGHAGSHANAGGQLAVATLFLQDDTTPKVSEEVAGCLRRDAGGEGACVMTPAYTTKMHNTASNNAGKLFEERSPCLDANSPAPALLTPMAVRRLTPRECERLQGFPDDWTLVPYRGKPAADGPRYKAIGNSWAVPVARWVGERVQMVEKMREAKHGQAQRTA